MTPPSSSSSVLGATARCTFSSLTRPPQSEEYFAAGAWSAEATTGGNSGTCYSTAPFGQDIAWIRYDLGDVESVARFALNNLDDRGYGPVTSVRLEVAVNDGEWLEVVAPRSVGQELEELPVDCP